MRPLPDAEQGAVVLRFPPEPSAYMEIGHCKSCVLNHAHAKAHGGKLIVRIDDTNPAVCKQMYVDAMLEDIKTLGIDYDRLTHTSDYFSDLIQMGVLLTSSGHLYADDSSADEMHHQRANLLPSPCRDRPVDESLAIFQEMYHGTAHGKAHCMRFKLDYASANVGMRDPVAFRCTSLPHWRTGTEYCVYPTYHLACPVVDAMEGVTHALRILDFEDHVDMYAHVIKIAHEVWPANLGNPKPVGYSKLIMASSIQDKGTMRTLVASKKSITGWDDPRLPTLRGMMRHGLAVSALKAFLLSTAHTRRANTQQWEKLWAENIHHIDSKCPRYTVLKTDELVPVTMEGVSDIADAIEVPLYGRRLEMGTKTVVRAPRIYLECTDVESLHEGEEITLMDWGNCVIKHIEMKDGRPFQVCAKMHLEGSAKSTMHKLTWIPAPEYDNNPQIPVKLRVYGPLINKTRMRTVDQLNNVFIDTPPIEMECSGESALCTLDVGDTVQLKRKGYFIVDSINSDDHEVTMIKIPDSKHIGDEKLIRANGSSKKPHHIGSKATTHGYDGSAAAAVATSLSKVKVD